MLVDVEPATLALVADRPGASAAPRLERRPSRAAGPEEVAVATTAVALTPRDLRVLAGRRRATGDPDPAFPWTIGHWAVGVADDGPVALLADGAAASRLPLPRDASTSEPSATQPDAPDDVSATSPTPPAPSEDGRPVDGPALVPLPAAPRDDLVAVAASIGPLSEALAVLDAIGPTPSGRRTPELLVTHGETALGRMLVRLAADAGYAVTATTPGTATHAALRVLGAARAVDRDVLPYGALPQFDVVLTEVDEPGPLHEHHPLHQALAATAGGGVLAALGAPPPEDATGKRVRIATPDEPGASHLRRAVALLAERPLADPLPPRPFPATDAAAALAALDADGEQRGAVVLTFSAC